MKVHNQFEAVVGHNVVGCTRFAVVVIVVVGQMMIAVESQCIETEADFDQTGTIVEKGIQFAEHTAVEVVVDMSAVDRAVEVVDIVAADCMTTRDRWKCRDIYSQ